MNRMPQRPRRAALHAAAGRYVMKISFSRPLGLGVALLMLGAWPAKAEYPDRPIRVMLGFPAGGGADIQGRWFVDKLKELSGATIILENKPGNSGNIAADLVA